MREQKIVDTKTNRQGIEIVDMLAAEGVTYIEARSILKSAEWELGKRMNKEKVSKSVSK